MNLQNELIKLITEDLKAVFKKELKEKDYLAQEDYETCKARAEAGMAAFTERATNSLALAIANHREKEHGDDVAVEKAELTAVMDDQSIVVGSLAWWSN